MTKKVIIREYGCVELVFSQRESEAVRMAIINLRRDLMRTLKCSVVTSVYEETEAQEKQTGRLRILIGTASNFEELDKKADLEKIRAKDGAYRKEAFIVQEKENELLIAGADRRGTIYGIYDFCEWLGVSPWYFFADVPVKRRKEAVIEEGYCKADYPSVEYRGIFINDEEELEHWVWEYMGEETIGVKTYEKIFELLLRLKLNYIWPAMHVNSFNVKRENGELADRMGIVVGTSHCDMLMRSNNREWKPWIEKKGYTDVEYDFSIPGKNREVLKEYWRESVEQNQAFEVSYTVGMRGIHDSGFETKSLEGLEGKELLEGKIKLLESVIKAQEDILKDTLDKEPLKIFVPYKEVLELYDNGLEVPEDLTLIWTNDNYGYVRRYPGEKEKQRKSGNGIYYHNSYWAPPGASYLFICSIPMAHTRNELLKAYNEGITKIWVTNFGAIKPLEQQLSFYAKLAWEADQSKERSLETEDEKVFLVKWLDGMFSEKIGERLTPLLLEFDQLTNARKLEHMDDDCFSQTAYGDEAAERLHRYEYICSEAGKIYECLKQEEKDAFFQLIFMKIQAAYFTNGMYYYADRSRLCMRQGKKSDADRYTKRSHEFDTARQKLIYYYNHVMSNGKWNRILTPEEFPPPRTAMYPTCRVPLDEAKDELIVTCWNEQEQLEFLDGTDKWIELANAGYGEIPYKAEIPEWLETDKDEKLCGLLREEKRILLRVKKDENEKALERSGSIIVMSGEIKVAEIPVTDKTRLVQREVEKKAGEINIKPERIAVADSERCVIEASNAMPYSESDEGGWKLIKNLARGNGSLLEANVQGSRCEFKFFLEKTDKYIIELHRFPTLSSVGRLRVGVTIDNNEMQVAESMSNDEHRASWKTNILNNVDKVYINAGMISEGFHSMTLTAIDKYVAFSRIVLYGKKNEAEKVVKNNLALYPRNEKLPKNIDLAKYCEHYYGRIELAPRTVLYLPEKVGHDTLADDDIIVMPKKKAEKTTPQQILKKAHSIAKENDEMLWLDAASALAQTEYAKAIDSADGVKWSYCDSPSYSETGLAMYIEEEGHSWRKNPADAPSLHFTAELNGGHYCVWVKTWQWGDDTSGYTVGIDGEIIPENKLYNGMRIWKYASEHVWKWCKAWECDLENGTHRISVYSLNSRLRIDQICLMKEGLPPADFR